MPSLKEIALEYAVQGWYVFPCIPGTKRPAVKWREGSSNNPGQVRAWWGRDPDCSVGIDLSRSDLCVVDIDHGLVSDEHGDIEAHIADAKGALGINGRVYTVRSGKRPGFGIHMYFEGKVPTGKLDVQGRLGRYTGDIKSDGGLIIGLGAIHPDSGAAYELYDDGPVLETPAAVRTMAAERQREAMPDEDAPITEQRNNTLTRIAGRWRGAGLKGDALRVALHDENERRCTPPLPAEEVDRIVDNAKGWKEQVDIEVVVGSKPPVNPSEWRGLFHSKEDTENTPDPEFLIRDFLQAESVTGIIGPARARKSIVTLNVIHALLTGEPLFGKFEVSNRPERVVYLCPESGKKSLGRRLRNMDLVRFIGETLFFTSMNSDPVALADPRLREAVRGSVLFIDTAIRFFNGDENSSQDMKLFGEQCHGLIRDGVNAVVLLHHTAKSAEGITLESGRGSGDFGGFLTCCWGTTLSDYEDAYNAQSLMSCVKQRDFQADSFKLAPSGNQDDFFLQYVEGSENVRVQVGAKEKAGKAKAVAYARAHPGMTAEALREALAQQGIKYSESSCRAMLRGVKALDVTG